MLFGLMKEFIIGSLVRDPHFYISYVNKVLHPVTVINEKYVQYVIIIKVGFNLKVYKQDEDIPAVFYNTITVTIHNGT